jgi:hypothetical protein
LEGAFLKLFTASRNPADMAVFPRHESKDRHQFDVAACFSPAAAEVARIFTAEPYAEPARDGLGLLAGDQRCWATLFPTGEK